MRTFGARARKWTRKEYYRLAELGLFRGQRVELLEGVIMVQSPQKWQHTSTTDRVAEVLRNRLGAGFWVRMQLSVNLGVHSEPEPDVSVVAGLRDDYSDHPTTALLIVEVSDTTVGYDRKRKGSLYAKAGIADYWIVNLKRRQLEVYRTPVPDATQRYGARYRDVTILRAGDVVSPLAAPAVQIPVADLLP